MQSGSSFGKACSRRVGCSLNRGSLTDDEYEADDADQRNYVEEFIVVLALLGETDLVFAIVEEDGVPLEGWLAEDCPVVEGFL